MTLSSPLSSHLLSLSIRHPKTAGEFKARNKLLQLCLRNPLLTYPITQEYPLLLSERNPLPSWCVFAEDTLIAHANYQKFSLYHPLKQRHVLCGFIGNVAVAQEFRHLGVSRRLFWFMEKKARRQQITSLFLWSDLKEYYQKLGFYPWGVEWHYTFSLKLFSTRLKVDFSIRVEPLSYCEKPLWVRLMKMRTQNGFTPQRWEEDTRKLLKIPNLFAFLCRRGESLIGYFIIGKGADFHGMIHEWGCVEEDAFLQGLYQLMTLSSLEECSLLAPVFLSDRLTKSFNLLSTRIEQHPLALAKFFDPVLEEQLAPETFIWGLDSI